MRPLFPPWLLALTGALVLAGVVAALLLAPTSGTYIFLPDRAHPVEPLVDVQGERPVRDGGGIYFVDVIVRRATLLERVFPGIQEGSSLVPEHLVNPTGVTDEQRRRRNLLEMRRSQSIAAAVALRELGYDVEATPTGVLITDVLPNTPAAGKLEPTDVVTAVDGRRVRTVPDLRRLITRRKPGDRLTVTVRRGNDVKRFELTTIADPDDASRPVIGVIPEQAADIDLPISVDIDVGEVGGPSAGLAFALDVLEELGRDVDHGYKVAVTGAIELDGEVSAVGGVRQKTIGAERSDVDVFVVPAGANAGEARKHAKGLRVIPVKSFRQALRALATLPAKE